jgi:hypothetical protein
MIGIGGIICRIGCGEVISHVQEVGGVGHGLRITLPLQGIGCYMTVVGVVYLSL